MAGQLDQAHAPRGEGPGQRRRGVGRAIGDDDDLALQPRGLQQAGQLPQASLDVGRLVVDCQHNRHRSPGGVRCCTGRRHSLDASASTSG